MGQPKAVIIIPSDASQQIKSAAVILSKYIKISTGGYLSIFMEPEMAKDESKVKIWLKPNLNKGQLNLDEDGFVISFPDRNDIVIGSRTEWGTEFAIYEFLERYVGVRWLMPGPDGEHVPSHPTLDILPGEVRAEPAFIFREFSGLKGEPQVTWARRNRMRGRIQFHHNLYRLFPPETYVKTHPEYFPLRNGKPYLPSSNNDQSWQPCFSAHGIVQEAVRNILDYFAQHPEATSYSLGINDSGNFCEKDQDRNGPKNDKNLLGYRDFSNPYFRWANGVAEGVLKEYPDKWFGCLAYQEVAQPPSKVGVNPRIIPYMTYDRMKWVDPQIRAEGEGLTEAWKSKSPVLGWYDYIYGTPYLVPRVYFHEMAEYYRWGYRNGVRAMYAEAYPNWGEGPKLYLALKLQWNPDLNVDNLLRDWYLIAVGPNAATDLDAYYQHWEKFWTERVVKSNWFGRSRADLYLAFWDPSYLDAVTYEDISKSRKLLESVLAKTQTPKQRVRAELLLRAFEYYEASVISYLGLVRGIREMGRTREYYESMNRKRYDLLNQFENDPVLVHPLRFDKQKYNRLVW
ncbi:MAG: DUF4838 domain-containing protein [Thermodesulfobacteriota bacterium]|jgi:hypothetical protein